MLHSSPRSTVSDDFRRAMRTQAASVAIVTTSHEGAFHGIAVTSFASVSMSPPSLLVCINRSSSFYERVWQTKRFLINILSDRHEHQCRVFGNPARRHERFADGEWDLVEGMPALKGARAVLCCSITNEMECGSHSTIFAAVESAALPKSSQSPLVYLDGRVVELRLDAGLAQVAAAAV